MSEIIQTFDFETKQIRIIGDPKIPWFLAKDICAILELSNVSQAVAKLPEKWKGIYQNDTLGGKQNMITISEAGVYKLIMRSDKPQSQKFQEWICEDLLPTLRNTGEYKMNKEYQLKLEKLEQENENVIKLLEKKEEQIKKLQRETQVVDGKNVCYLCTSDDKEKEGIYTIGQTINLKNRLQEYNDNKLSNFKIVKYISCKSEKIMDAVEVILLSKFNRYKIVSRRDVFQLPEGSDISLFTQWFDYMQKFCEDIENVEDDVEVAEDISEEIVFDPNAIIMRKIDNYIHLPTLCKFYGKSYNSYANYLTNKLYLEKQVKINPDCMKRCFAVEGNGTWANIAIAIHAANWISDSLAPKVEKHIEYLKSLPEVESEYKLIQYTLPELMNSSTKKETLQDMCDSFGLASSKTWTKRQLTDNILLYLTKGDVYMQDDNYFKKCDICLEQKDLNDVNFLATIKDSYKEGFGNTCRTCMIESINPVTAPVAKTVDELKTVITEETETRNCKVCSKDFALRDMHGYTCKFCRTEAKSLRETGVKRTMTETRAYATVEIKEGEKFCNKCKSVKLLDDFSGEKARKSTYCRPCMSTYRNEKRLKKKLEVIKS